MTRRRKLALAVATAVIGVSTGLVVRGHTSTAARPSAPRAVEVTAPAPEVARVLELARKPDAVAQLTAAYAATDDLTLQLQVIDTLAQRGDAEAVAWLASVANSDSVLAKHAAQALAHVSNTTSEGALASIAGGTQPAMVRASAARALGKAGTGASTTELVRLVADAQQPVEVRQEAALALASSSVDRDTVVALAATLDRETGSSPASEQLRIAIIRALAASTVSEAKVALANHANGLLSQNERAWIDRSMR